MGDLLVEYAEERYNYGTPPLLIVVDGDVEPVVDALEQKYFTWGEPSTVAGGVIVDVCVLGNDLKDLATRPDVESIEIETVGSTLNHGE